MRVAIVLVLLLLVPFASVANSQDLDSVEVKIFLETLVETAGQAISGGVLWSANTHGGLPHFSLGVGTNIVSVKAYNPVIPGDSLIAAIPTAFVYGSLGILPGFKPSPMVGGIGSVDIIGKFGYVPLIGEYEEYAKWSPAIFGGGVRIGLFRNSLAAPAISLSITYSKASQLRFLFSDPGADAVATISLSTFSIHGDISKNLLLFTPYAGLGWDQHYFKADWDVDFTDPSYPDVSGGLNLRPTSLRFYGGVELPLVIIHLNAEGGLTGGNLYFAAGGRIGI
jgi:hypothetical protein